MPTNKRSKNKVSIYIKDANLVKLSYYRDVFKEVHKIDLNISSIIQLLCDTRKTIDDLISELDKSKNKGITNEQN